MGQATIPITIDKSHLTTIGRRLYSESLDLVRELVANAYDADATVVKINLAGGGLTVWDNGLGMDRNGLVQYFTIGSGFKKTNPVTEKFNRRRIGEFGIGKFAVLSVCDRFELATQKNGYAATVIFDKNDFESRNNWEVPLLEQASNHKTSYTRITLFDLKTPIGREALEQRLRQQLPLTEKDFTVLLDDVELKPRHIAGRKFFIREQTGFGLIAGEIVVSALILAKEDIGISVNVKGISLNRGFLGLEKSHQLPLNRLTGRIRADWLPLTAARDSWLKDSPEGRLFLEVITKNLKRLSRYLFKQKATAADKKADQALSAALVKIKTSLKKNRDIFLLNDLPLFDQEQEKNDALAEAVGAGVFTQRLTKKKGALAKAGKLPGEISRRLPKLTRNRVKTILKDQKRLVKKLKIGGVNIVCSLSRLGPDQPESFTEGGVIFINRDHPLFSATAREPDLAAFYLARLITQELVLLAQPGNVRTAYDWQSRLLTDAIIDKNTHAQ
ncbi:hypothetical protein CO018_00390 [Candidatus Beckwithbacteria bacterium CG_4_9_14_0_2_um_filter_47_11]|uniref:ATP-binding protein n=3 Tax=Candidatus Beckwithiibacteriota TaxID=1752726 RepID=A0A2M8G517_9BACT|nr:MAG: hypothetical protein CO018_00390 [Candidatus Beckwithbacteria bacterium CG_4_9_14_0_2_um_filter_47_11]